jgi:uncharacterized protein (DUF433 family)
MKLNTETEKTIWRHSGNHHPSSRHRSARRAWDSAAWTSRGYFDKTDHQPDCGDIVLGYSGELLALFDRAIKLSPSISMDPNIMDGQPCIAGTRIPVRAVLRVIEHYGSLDEAIRCYPHLTKDQIKDALYFSQVMLELPSGLDETPSAS